MTEIDVLIPNIQISDWVRDQFAPGYRGYCIDIGASDGVSVNSTWALEKLWKWNVISVEANPYFKDRLAETRDKFFIMAASDEPAESGLFHVHMDNLESFSSLKPTVHPNHSHALGERWTEINVPITTLNLLLKNAQWDKLDALCVDTEGTERDVLKGLDWSRWRPKVILIENWDQGGLDDFLCPLGYERVLRHAENDGYIHRQWGLLG